MISHFWIFALMVISYIHLFYPLTEPGVAGLIGNPMSSARCSGWNPMYAVLSMGSLTHLCRLLTHLGRLSSHMQAHFMWALPLCGCCDVPSPLG